MKTHTTIFLFLFLLPSIAISLTKPKRCHPDDERVLLQIKNHFRNGTLFSTWIPHTDCCKWRIVLCKKLPKTTTHRVNFLEIDGADDLVGTIPSLVGHLPYLEILIFRNLPNLTGPIPPSIAKLTHLNFILLNWNSLTGPIPNYFKNLKKLVTLGLNNNHFTGSIPSYFGNLPNLQALDLNDNQLTGTIPPSFGSFGSGISLTLSNNKLSGTIPRSLGKANFSSLQLARNRLTGDASFLFGKDKTEMKSLDLSWNQLSFDLTNIVMPVDELWSTLLTLDVSHNKIYGRLPAWLGQAPSMYQLNVSYNRLCGRIPTVGGKLQEFDASTFAHNKCLCGAPLAPCKSKL